MTLKLLCARAVKAAALVIVVCLTSCIAPSDPQGSDIGTRYKGGERQVAIAVCADEVVTNVRAHSVTNGMDQGPLIWAVKGAVSGTKTGVVIITMGHQGEFEATETAAKRSSFSDEFSIAYESNLHTQKVILDQRDFRRSDSGGWLTAGGFKPLSRFHSTLCGTD
ncbi:MAG: hypothetical protein M3Q98_13900 [Actinomycetota bacterium]|nr:hypothetical protein [Actinomycetota bacterium]